MSEKTKAYLLLNDGTYFEGIAIGVKGSTVGEICFNTGMTGYQEVFSDPSYSGQIIIMTSTHIGNYGVTVLDNESNAPKISGLICKKFSSKYSRLQAESSLQEYLEKHQIVGISNIDTRSLVTYLRNKGAMNAIISTDFNDVVSLQSALAKAPEMNGLELASVVSTKVSYSIGNPDATYKVAVLDLGVKQNILNCFIERDCFLTVFPAKTTFEEMQNFEPDGYFLSNGPGDPSVADYAINTTQKILEHNIPLFGICLGHQILALANGINTYKMHHGHRGLNHPIKNLKTGLCEITSQNHGFGIKKEEVINHPSVDITHINLNDDTVEGIQLNNKKAFSVQYHPESSPGPQDSRYLFDDFIALMKK